MQEHFETAWWLRQIFTEQIICHQKSAIRPRRPRRQIFTPTFLRMTECFHPPLATRYTPSWPPYPLSNFQPLITQIDTDTVDVQCWHARCPGWRRFCRSTHKRACRWPLKNSAPFASRMTSIWPSADDGCCRKLIPKWDFSGTVVIELTKREIFLNHFYSYDE